MSAPAVGGAIPCGVAQTTSGNAQLNQPVEPPPSPFPAPGEVMKIVDVWTRPGSKGKILFRLYPGDEVTVLEMSGVHALITCKEGEGYANMNRLSFQFAGDIPAKAITRGSLYTMPKKGETGDKIKDSGFKQNDEFFATSRIGKWIHVYQTGGLDGWILATKLKLMI